MKPDAVMACYELAEKVKAVRLVMDAERFEETAAFVLAQVEVIHQGLLQRNMAPALGKTR